MITNRASKTLGIFALLLLSLSFASAGVIEIFNLQKPSSVTENSSSFTFTFNITYTGTLPSADITLSDSVVSPFGTLSFSNTNGFNGLIDESRVVTGTVSGYSNMGGQSINIVINASLPNSRNDSVSFSVPITDVIATSRYCSNGTVGDLQIKNFDVNNNGEGTDDDWEPLDSITIDVDVKNTNTDDDIKNVLVEIKILDSDNNDVTSDFNFKDDQIDLGRINNKDTETATFTIEEVPADLEEGNYKVYVKAYSDDDEELQCVDRSSDLSENDEYQAISFSRVDDKAVVIRAIDLSNSIQATCGEKNLAISFPVYNTGADKEEKVLVNLYSKELGLDEYQVIDNLRSGKRKDVSFLVNIPQELSKTLYKIEVINFFDYNEGDELESSSYDSNSKDDLEESYKINLNILSCGASSLEPVISASLESEAKIGSELSVKFEVTNTGSETINFEFSAEGYESWADLISITPESKNIKAGESVDVLVKLTPKTTGTNKFSLNAVSDKTSSSQDVSVKVSDEKSSSFNFSKDNVVLYLIISIAALIILIFITLLIRGSRNRE